MLIYAGRVLLLREQLMDEGQHLLKHCSRKSRPSLDSTSGITGGSFDEAMWNSADTCHAAYGKPQTGMPNGCSRGTASSLADMHVSLLRVRTNSALPSTPVTQVDFEGACEGAPAAFTSTAIRPSVKASAPGSGTGSRGACQWPSR